MNSASNSPRSPGLLHTWFSCQGRLTVIELWLKGIAPGILLGVFVVRLDAAADARGLVIYPYLAFSLWPATALFVKRWRDWRCIRQVMA
jgi:uncharacterized membrane protein YhaH (DUF805 family)